MSKTGLGRTTKNGLSKESNIGQVVEKKTEVVSLRQIFYALMKEHLRCYMAFIEIMEQSLKDMELDGETYSAKVLKSYTQAMLIYCSRYGIIFKSTLGSVDLLPYERDLSSRIDEKFNEFNRFESEYQITKKAFRKRETQYTQAIRQLEKILADTESEVQAPRYYNGKSVTHIIKELEAHEKYCESKEEQLRTQKQIMVQKQDWLNTLKHKLQQKLVLFYSMVMGNIAEGVRVFMEENLRDYEIDSSQIPILKSMFNDKEGRGRQMQKQIQQHPTEGNQQQLLFEGALNSLISGRETEQEDPALLHEKMLSIRNNILKYLTHKLEQRKFLLQHLKLAQKCYSECQKRWEKIWPKTQAEIVCCKKLSNEQEYRLKLEHLMGEKLKDILRHYERVMIRFIQGLRMVFSVIQGCHSDLARSLDDYDKVINIFEHETTKILADYSKEVKKKGGYILGLLNQKKILNSSSYYEIFKVSFRKLKKDLREKDLFVDGKLEAFIELIQKFLKVDSQDRIKDKECILKIQILDCDAEILKLFKSDSMFDALFSDCGSDHNPISAIPGNYAQVRHILLSKPKDARRWINFGCCSPRVRKPEMQYTKIETNKSEQLGSNSRNIIQSQENMGELIYRCRVYYKKFVDGYLLLNKRELSFIGDEKGWWGKALSLVVPLTEIKRVIVKRIGMMGGLSTRLELEKAEEEITTVETKRGAIYFTFENEEPINAIKNAVKPFQDATKSQSLVNNQVPYSVERLDKSTIPSSDLDHPRSQSQTYFHQKTERQYNHQKSMYIQPSLSSMLGSSHSVTQSPHPFRNEATPSEQIRIINSRVIENQYPLAMDSPSPNILYPTSETFESSSISTLKQEIGQKNFFPADVFFLLQSKGTLGQQRFNYAYEKNFIKFKVKELRKFIEQKNQTELSFRFEWKVYFEEQFLALKSYLHWQTITITIEGAENREKQSSEIPLSDRRYRLRKSPDEEKPSIIIKKNGKEKDQQTGGMEQGGEPLKLVKMLIIHKEIRKDQMLHRFYFHEEVKKMNVVLQQLVANTLCRPVLLVQCPEDIPANPNPNSNNLNPNSNFHPGPHPNPNYDLNPKSSYL